MSSAITGILSFITRLVARLPLSSALAFGRAAGWFYGSVIRYHRKDAVATLTRSFPDKPPAEIRSILERMYRNLGMNLAELSRFATAPDSYFHDHIAWEGEEHIREALARGRGVLILTGHLGNWDLACTAFPRFGHPTTIITKEIKNKAVSDYWMGLRARFGLKFLPKQNSYRKCLAVLKKNEVIGFILDQNMTRDEGIFVDFFGKPACTTPGLAFMSAHSGAPVVPVFIIREEGGRHWMKVLPLIEPPPDREPETIRRFTQQYTRIIEDMIRQYPDQWTWIHRRWRTFPLPGDAYKPAVAGE